MIWFFFYYYYNNICVPHFTLGYFMIWRFVCGIAWVNYNKLGWRVWNLIWNYTFHVVNFLNLYFSLGIINEISLLNNALIKRLILFPNCLYFQTVYGTLSNKYLWNFFLVLCVIANNRFSLSLTKMKTFVFSFNNLVVLLTNLLRNFSELVLCFNVFGKLSYRISQISSNSIFYRFLWITTSNLFCFFNF